MTTTTQTIGGQYLTFQSSGSTTTIYAVNPSSNRVYTIPDAGTNAQFVLSAISGTSFPAIILTNVTNQITMGTTNTVTIDSVAPSASRVYTLPDTSTNSNFLMSDGVQTINGTNTFSSGVIINPTSNQLVMGGNGASNTITITAPTPAGNRIYTIPDAGGSASFVMSGGSGTIFTAITLTNVTNQITMGTTNTVTIDSIAPAASRTYTIPDTGANSSFVMTDFAQTVNGVKTFTSGVPISAMTNQLVLGSTNTTTLSATAPAASRTYTFPDAGASANVVLTQGTQTIVGSTTFSSEVAITPTSNQMVLGGSSASNTITITAPTPAASRTYTIPDAGGSANFMLTAGTQTVTGQTTFNNIIINNGVSFAATGVTETITLIPATAIALTGGTPTITTLLMIGTTSGTNYFLTVKVNGLGSDNSTSCMTLMARVKNIAGTLTLGATFNNYNMGDSSLAQCSLGVTVSGTNILIQMTTLNSPASTWIGSVDNLY